MSPRILLTILASSIVIVSMTSPFYAAAQQLNAVHTFVCNGEEGEGNCPDGGVPTSIIQGSDGNFYGVASETLQQPEEAGGLVFSLTPSGDFSVLYAFEPGQANNFPDGQDPVQLVEGPDGMLYGETDLGGANNAGTVFRLNRDGSGFQLIHSFCYNCGTGYDPLGLAAGNDAVYGATFYSGSSKCACGTIFRVDVATGAYKIVKQTKTVPSNPLSGPNGMLYWTVQGDLFIYNETTGKIQGINLNLPRGDDHFKGSAGSLVFGANGNLYGIYGAPGKGSGLFEIQPDGTNLVLFPLNPNLIQGISSGLVLGGDGNLWMEQSEEEAGYGEILTISPTDGSVIQSLTPFSQTSAVGGYPDDLISAANGSLWGLTMLYGEAPEGSSGEGVVFSLTPQN
jgi:uncharacterized repeat protein (TIGR03803 family)